jgi:hypothetical protein
MNFEFCKKVNENLLRVCQKIYRSTTNELNEESRNIMNELQLINKQTEKVVEDDFVKESRAMIRKLILIFARCSRLFEFLRQSTKESPREKKTPQLEKKESKKFTIGTLLSKFGFGTTSEKEITENTITESKDSPVPPVEVILSFFFTF